MISKNVLRDIYHRKVELLLNGLRITDNFLECISQYPSSDWDKGRKGGAGPAGGRYFMFENGSVVNAGLWGSQSEQSYLLLDGVTGFSTVHPENLVCIIRNLKTQTSYEIELIPVPKAYNNAINLSNTINKQIALIHGANCLASTIVQKCRYWGEKKACAFCGIEFSLIDESTIEKKTPEQLIHAIHDASELNLVQHITLTMGTLSTPDKGAEYYIKTVSKIKQQFPDLPIHIQIEPFDDVEKLLRLKQAGVNTIGVHLEIPDDALRKKYCPGKFLTSRFDYEAFWKTAVDIFGRGQVSSFILLGFGEDFQDTIQYIKKIIEIGVIPNVMPVRDIVGTELDYLPITYESLLSIFDATASSLIKNSLDPNKNIAGCIRCGGCSAIIDAYNYHKSKNAHHNN